MEYRDLKITLQSAMDLQNVNLFTKMDVYAVVSVYGGDNNQKTKTPVDHDGDANPTWNFPMNFKLDESALQMNRLFLDFKFICQRTLGDKDVGDVTVPIKELLDSQPNSSSVMYQVTKPNGKPKGQISFIYEFSDKIAAAAAVTTPPYSYAIPPGKTETEPVIAYPVGSSSGYPEPGPGVYPPTAPYPISGGHYPPPPMPYPKAEGSGYYPPAGYGYPPPPSAGYGYPPPPAGYGYAPNPGSGYPPPPVQAAPAKKNKFGGMGLGAGLLGGAIGGLLIGDMISDAADFDF